MAIMAKKMCRHCLLVPYQDQPLSRPAYGIGVGLASCYSQRFSPRAGTDLIRINSGGKDVLACRHVAIVVSALGKASHVLAIDGQDKAEIAPKICDSVNEQMTCILRRRHGPEVGCAPGGNQASAGQTQDVNK